jgi:2-iminobutanoate/2-iminopropanoate deaminase
VKEKDTMLPPEKEVIIAAEAPKPIGPYNAGIRAGHMIYTAGQLGLDRATGELVPGGIEAETRKALQNIQNILESAGSNVGRIVKTTVYLRDMGEFAKMNAIYAEFFPTDPPARTTVEVSGLPKNGAVEIEAVAVLSPSSGD